MEHKLLGTALVGFALALSGAVMAEENIVIATGEKLEDYMKDNEIMASSDASMTVESETMFESAPAEVMEGEAAVSTDAETEIEEADIPLPPMEEGDDMMGDVPAYPGEVMNDSIEETVR